MKELPYSFGRYVLERKIAQGGMAEIYEAKYVGEGGFEKKVAVKRVLPAWSDSKDFIMMLCDEAKALVNLQHQNIVQVYELGKDGDAFYISMEYVEGVDVKRLIKKVHNGPNGGTIPLKFTCFIVAEILKALNFSHNKGTGIIHRDISPQNILVSFNGEVKVADFGIAKGFHRSFHTTISQIKGKYSYMSPEQAEGRNVDARTDLYSVGLILFELLKKERLQDPLQKIVLKAMQREPSLRYQTAMEFLSDLNAFVVKEGLITDSIELSEYLRSQLKDDSVDISQDKEETKHDTKLLSLPKKTTKKGGMGFRCILAGVLSIFASFICSGPHAFQILPPLEVEKKQEEPTVSVVAPVVNVSTLSIQARPWGYVYLGGYLSKKETPINGLKVRPGEYLLKVNYEPEDKWVEKRIILTQGSRKACFVDFSSGVDLICR